MNKKKVTIGLASYKRPELLAEAISSISSQDYDNLEIVIYDNGSCDEAVISKIKAFAVQDPRVSYMISTTNHGAFHSFRTLLENSTGEYFVWLADDDSMAPHYISLLVNELEGGSCALAYGLPTSVGNDQNYHKILANSVNSFKAIVDFIKFDSDSIFYGLYRPEAGKQISFALKDWHMPNRWKIKFPFLLYNFVSYPFIYGLLCNGGGFSGVNRIEAAHYIGGVPQIAEVQQAKRVGFWHFELLVAYLYLHIQMANRFARVAFARRSFVGMVLAPFGSLYLFFRRISVSYKIRRMQ